MAKAKSRRRLLRRILLVALALAGAFVLWLLAVWPPPLWYRTHWPDATAFMEMREEQAKASGRALPARRYRPVPMARIAPAMQQAVIIAEDQRFRQHGGLDYVEMRKALGYRRTGYSWTSPGDVGELLRAVMSSWTRRGSVRGASTITQQLAKNLYLSPSRNPLRKVKEAVTAWRLEAALDKDRILELYLNTVELGPNLWGVEAASRKYFDRPASRLTRQQAAALAATLPFPLRSNPGYRPARMRARQQIILRRMQGERIAVPKVAAEPSADAEQPAVAVEETPAMESLLDSLRAPVETLPPESAGIDPADGERMAEPGDLSPLPIPSDS
jgi:monofunctional biosynthetic peptidoglycan transglycosylase